MKIQQFDQIGLYWRSILRLARHFSVLMLLVLHSTGAQAGDLLDSTYVELVDGNGNITLPNNFATTWVFLGTWSVAAKDVGLSSEASGHGAAGLHNVYTQPGVVEYFRLHKSFPDGAVLVKELLQGVTAQMTTGTVSRAGEVEGWFVMVKDSKGRFKDNPLWGDGWGWVLFNADDRSRPVTQNFRAECSGCHIPARDTDWIYVQGYPLLQSGD